MQHHKARKAGVSFKRYNPVLPEYTEAQEKKKHRLSQENAIYDFVESLTFEEIAKVYDEGNSHIREVIENVWL